jgi:hypothetical protein
LQCADGFCETFEGAPIWRAFNAQSGVVLKLMRPAVPAGVSVSQAGSAGFTIK